MADTDDSTAVMTPQFVCVHSVIELEDGTYEHTNGDDYTHWNVWVRVGNSSDWCEDLNYAGLFNNRTGAMIYAETLSQMLGVEIDEY